MSNTIGRVHTVVPAQVSFLAIYNPSLGKSDENLQDQVVYYYTCKANKDRRRKPGEALADIKHEEQNERLRQIGLAQGMVEFAKAFADGEALDAVDSEKSRILLHELEPGWWILASIDLTRLQSFPDDTANRTTGTAQPNIEYSAREVCPQGLLLQHLLRAYSIFCLHHAPSFGELYSKITRPKFCGTLELFWDRFIRDWDVLLHGNPAVDIYNGLKLAAGGELGIGVGEEDWGSGEREVLEGFIDRTEGLVDLIVSRFGDAPHRSEADSATLAHPSGPISASKESSWLGDGQAQRASDGVIFSGIGTVTRPSIRTVSAWMEWLYRYGQNAYGVEDSPHSTRRRKRRKVDVVGVRSASAASKSQPDSQPQSRSVQAPTSKESISRSPAIPSTDQSTSIPPPIVRAVSRSLENATAVTERAQRNVKGDKTFGNTPPAKDESPTSGTETLMKYLTLGIYGSSWGIAPYRPQTQRRGSEINKTDNRIDNNSEPVYQKPVRQVQPEAVPVGDNQKTATNQDPSKGYFMIGLRGDLENEDITEDEGNGTETGTGREDNLESKGWNDRTLLRTLHVERVRPKNEESSNNSTDTNKISGRDFFDRLRVIVYVHQPFIFTFLFEPQTDSLSMSSFYRSLHYQLGPLQRPLLTSTSPTKLTERLRDAGAPTSTTAVDNSQPIYDLVYDPTNLTVHTTIPSIPEPAVAEGLAPTEVPWTRIEALNVHSQILNTYMSTRRRTSELERTCKTNRGWWVVWMRLPHGRWAQLPGEQHKNADFYREAFLIRKASDYTAPAVRKASARFGRDPSGSSGWGPGKLAEGIGIDTRRYIEGLLSLNR
ncbi:MAG: hypothetical protein Q9187_001923 [Circinaria calcarea]